MRLVPYLAVGLVAIVLAMPRIAIAQTVADFFGTYAGSAVFDDDGGQKNRDLSTKIEPTKEGFRLSWTSVTYRRDGSSKSKSYTVDFVPSERDNIYSSAMKTNLFGKAVPLDPLQGDPFVWARFEGATMTVFSLFISDIGDYEMQEFHRTLTASGLDLLFRRFSNGELSREINAELKRQD